MKQEKDFRFGKMQTGLQLQMNNRKGYTVRRFKSVRPVFKVYNK